MPPPLRNFMLTVHLAVSVGWVGAVAAYLVLDITTVTSQDVQTVRAAYIGMDLIARYVIVPLALSSLLTGMLMALGTRWGLIRHYWVVISFLLTLFAVVVLLVELQTIGRFASVAADPDTSNEELLTLPSTLLHSGLGLVVLLVILGLNVYKPRGLTPYGFRKLRKEQSES